MIAFLPVLLWSAAGAEAPDWRAFDRRQAGTGDSTYSYDAASLRRHGRRVRVWYRFQGHFSGIPDEDVWVRVRIDCRRGTSTTLQTVTYNPAFGRRTSRSNRGPRPIRPDSVEAALARRVCA